MQVLRHASRRALHASVLQGTFAASVKAYSSEAASTVAARKTKERSELAKEFVLKYKAVNDGQLPGITLLRKEVGGKYVTLKEVLQEFAKSQGEADAPRQTVRMKDAEEKSQESAAIMKDGLQNKARFKEDSKKDKKEVSQVSKGSKPVKKVDPPRSRTTSKALQSVMEDKDSSMLTTDNGLITDKDDDDSDVAAPEYPEHPPLIQMAHHKVEEGVTTAKGKEKALENGSVAQFKKQTDGQVIKSKNVDIKQRDTGLKQPDVTDGGIRAELPHKDQVGNAVHQWNGGNYSFGSKFPSPLPLTTVARIANLPQHMTVDKLKAMCENVAKVLKVELRRRNIADVHFDVDVEEMNDVLNRLRGLAIGTFKWRVFPAQRFSCKKMADGQFNPQDALRHRQVRNALFNLLEHRFKYLRWQIQDYRDLQEMKLAR